MLFICVFILEEDAKPAPATMDMDILCPLALRCCQALVHCDLALAIEQDFELYEMIGQYKAVRDTFVPRDLEV